LGAGLTWPAPFFVRARLADSHLASPSFPKTS